MEKFRLGSCAVLKLCGESPPPPPPNSLTNEDDRNELDSFMSFGEASRKVAHSGVKMLEDPGKEAK